METLKGFVGEFDSIMQLHYPNICVCQFHPSIPYHPSFAGRTKNSRTGGGDPCEATVIYLFSTGSQAITLEEVRSSTLFVVSFRNQPWPRLHGAVFCVNVSQEHLLE